jgi:drug/metabolite transporter (DMT)-like permease
MAILQGMSDAAGPSPFRATLLVGTAAVMWGTWSLFFRAAEAHGPVSPAAEALIVFAVVFMAAAPAAARDTAKRRPARSALLALAGLGLVDALNVLLFFAAMQRGSVSVAVLTHYLAPILVAVGAPLVVGERVRRVVWGALAISLLGLALLLEPWRSAGVNATAAAALGSSSAVFSAANILLSKRLKSAFTASELLAWRMPSALLLLWLCVPSGGLALSLRALSPLVAGALIPGALAGWMFYRGLGSIPASRAGTLTLLEPATAMVVSVVVWHEPVGTFAAVGAAAILLGAYLCLADPGRERDGVLSKPPEAATS